MLKKLLTGCLTIAMAAALTVPAMAAEISGTVQGRIVAELVQYTESGYDGTGDASTHTYMDMQSHGRLGYQVTATEGDWTVTGKIESRANFGDTDGYDVLQKYVKLENDAFSVALGRQWFAWVYMTPFMGDTIDRWCYGCSGAIAGAQGTKQDLAVGALVAAGLSSGSDATADAITDEAVAGHNLRDDRLVFTLKSVGLQIVYGMNNSGDGYDVTETGLGYSGSFGIINVAAQYISKTSAINANQINLSSSTYEDEETPGDGSAFTSMSFGVQAVINEAMFIEFDYESETYTSGTADADTAAGTTMGLAFAMALSETMGFAVAYDMNSYNGGADDETNTSLVRMTANFQAKMAGQNLWAGYRTNTLTHEDIDDPIGSTEIVFGSRVNF